ncbi:MAG: hypothetical protein AUJ31_02985 [Parcubacteria group bacterium CG1_02_39_15]|uniref:DNA polymerase III subunit delta n=1 Tax=Candidatus Nealsonbacteria bacterium CG_4_10_14_0_2_um_filter_39_15 TaxID=1974681 RepID=A0A2M7UWT7_9BACT|nr:MAG: hypothetical protein AUJ31_02985 [Parcubacteria group bacterium CG1_02_39_15]PIZ88440.1 MAG: hypothetical protein COX91_00135 [Candidatus Nealsonbacteria bacterium CG_4_10_14_0_2_um_filter_39_15]
MIIGHQKQWQFLENLFQSKRIPHALLFCGPEKLGKRTIALEFVKLICGKDILEREHPDFILVEPEQKEIQISQIRELSWRLALKPYSSPFKIAVINKAHCLNPEAQNSLLKTLEEPKGNAILILITSLPEALFPTIRSRCEIIKFYPVKNSEIEKFLRAQKTVPEKWQEIISLASGRPGLVMDLLQTPQAIDNQKKIRNSFIKIIQSDLFLRFQYAKTLSADSENLKNALEIWMSLLRDALISKIKGKAGLGNYSATKLIEAIRKIQTTNFLISTTNVNPKLALEVLLMEL